MPAAGFIGAGCACPGKRRSGATASFSVTFTGLTNGRAQHATTLGYSTNPGGTVQAQRWQSSPGGAGWTDIPGGTGATQTVDITGGAHSDGHALRVGVTIDGEELFSGPVLLAYAAPGLVQSLTAQGFTENTGVQTYDAGIAFAGTDLDFSITPTAGITIAPGTGVISFDTDQMVLQSDTPLSVSATNSGGTAQANLTLTLSAAQTHTLIISGLTNGTALVGAHTGLSLTPPTGVTFSAPTWGTSFGEASYGTASSPSDYTVGDFGTLHWQASGDDGNTYRASAPIARAAPVATGGLVDQSFLTDTGIQTYDVAGDFTGDALTYAISGPAGVTINTGGVVSFDTHTLGEQNGTASVVTASNSGGSAQSGFGLTLSAAQIITLDIQGLTSGIAEISSHASLSVTPPTGVTFSAPAWGISYGEASYGTGSNPTGLTSGDGQDLHWQAQGSDGNTYRASAPIRHAAPTAAGGIGDQDVIDSSPITALDVAADFTGQALGFALAPGSAPLPAGLVLSASGQITGTPTTIAAQVTIVVRAANSGGFADSGFGLTISDSAPFAIEEIGEEPVITAENGDISITIGSGPYAGTYTTRHDGSPLTVAMVQGAQTCFRRPEVTGTTGDGDALVILPGLWIYDGPDLGDQTWVQKIDGSPGETDLDYTVQTDDLGKTFTVEETYGGLTVTSTPLTLGGGTSLTLPGDIAGLLQWYDAADTATITETGGAVSLLMDKSAQLRNAAQTSGSNQPTTGAITVNGLNAIQFDGANDFLENDAMPMSADGTLIIVCRPTALSGTFDSIVSYNGAKDFQFEGRSAGYHGAINSNAHSLLTNDTDQAGSVVAYVYRWNLATGTAELFANGGAAGASAGNYTTSYDTTPTMHFRLGTNRGKSAFAGMDLCEFAIFDTALSNTELNDLGAYLTRWGITWSDMV